MDSSKNTCVALCFSFLVFPVVIMQGVGCFSESLLYTSDCGGVSLLSKCCFSDPSENDYYFIHHFPSEKENPCAENDAERHRLSEKALALHLTSFIACLLFAIGLIIIYTMSRVCYKQDNDASLEAVTVIMCIASVVYSISGILSLVGCVIVGGNSPRSSSFGPAFYMSLSSGIYIVLQCCCTCAYFKQKDDDERKKPRIIVRQPLAMTPSSGDMVHTRNFNADVTETRGVLLSQDGNVIFYQARRAQLSGPLR